VARLRRPGWRGSSHSVTPVQRLPPQEPPELGETTVAFRGTFDFTLDAKNRLTVPAKFRAALADGVVLARGSGRCVEMWPAADFEASTDRALGDLNPLSQRGKELKRRLFAATFDTELDAAGRVMLPAKLIEHAALARDVSV